MAKLANSSRSPIRDRVLGDKVFAAISAIEGISLKSGSLSRIASVRSRNLSPAEQRAEVVQAYAKLK